MSDAVNIPEVVAEVTAAHHRYERALTSNNLDELDELFWDDPRTLRYGPNGALLGHAAISEYRRSRTGEPPRRTVTHFYVVTFGRDFASTNQEAKREPDGQITRQSQTWVRQPGGWRIVCAHVSDQPASNRS